MQNLDPVSIVVPVYNSEKSLPILLDRLQSVFGATGNAFEMILVEDGSRDGSWSVVCDLAKRCPNVRGFRMLRNYGQHNALLCGIRAAKNPIIVTMDDDLQNPPEEIPKLSDRCVASRQDRGPRRSCNHEHLLAQWFHWQAEVQTD